MSMMETRDAGGRDHTSGGGRAAPSQQVDDVGQEDQTHDGEEHQHQHVHHVEKRGRGRTVRGEKHTTAADAEDRLRSETFGCLRRETSRPAPPTGNRKQETGSGLVDSLHVAISGCASH